MTLVWFDEAPDTDAPTTPANDQGVGGAEVIIFPGLNLRWLNAVMEMWRRTGRPFKGAPDPTKD